MASSPLGSRRTPGPSRACKPAAGQGRVGLGPGADHAQARPERRHVARSRPRDLVGPARVGAQPGAQARRQPRLERRRRRQGAVAQVRHERVDVARQRVEQQREEARVPDRDQREVASPQQEQQRDVAEALDVAQVAQVGRDRQRGLRQALRQSAQVGRVVLEAHRDQGPLRRRGCEAGRGRDRPVGPAARHPRLAQDQVAHPGRHGPPQLGLQRGRVGDPLGGAGSSRWWARGAAPAPR